MTHQPPIQWHGDRPADIDAIEARVLSRLVSDGVNMSKPSDLIYSVVSLTDDIEGPSVTVWGEEDNNSFHAEYFIKTGWATASDLVED